LIIAATALEHGLAVATLNEREFRRFEGLGLSKTAPYRDSPTGR
jgi:predicted nucleic acid-binding protein